MYIRKYKSGFRVEVQTNGQRKSGTFATKREATEWGRLTEIEFSSFKPDNPQFTVKDAFDQYALEVSPKKAGAKWELLRLAVMLDYFKPETDLTTIQPPQIAKWRDDRLQAVKTGTVLREANLLRNVFTVARLEWHWIDASPFDGVKLPKEPDARYQRWNWQEIKRVVRRLGYVTGQVPATKNQEVAARL